MPSTAAEPFIHVVAGLLRRSPDSPEFLIARRKQGSHLEGLWEFPGGKLEAGESRFQALRRELREELGIQVRQALPLQSVLHRYPDRNIHLDVWEVTRFDGELRGREDQEVLWIKPGDIGDFEFPEADYPILGALRLPSRLLITPDVSMGHEQSFIDQFSRLIAGKLYPRVQFRAHHLDDQSYARLAHKLNDICKPAGAELAINRGSFESHQSPLFDDFRHRHLNSRLLTALNDKPFDNVVCLSASCHDLEELKLAQRIGCDYAVLSTVRSTHSHPGRQAKGWRGINVLAKSVNLPVYALGGVSPSDFAVARYQGAVGVAGISAFWSV